jgi:murein L,D-transpeptidase YcbB/YkuD
MRLRNLVILVGLLATLASPGRAADANGDHAVRGVGVASCATFVAELERDGYEKFLFAGWLNGYLTAWNQLQPDTFEVASWQTLDTLAEYLRQNCENSPDRTFYAVAAAMLQRLMDQRLTTRSDTTTFQHGDNSTVLYQDVLERVKQQLEERRLLDDAAAAPADAVARALERYQGREGLAVTGLPDQATLHRLLMSTD